MNHLTPLFLILPLFLIPACGKKSDATSQPPATQATAVTETTTKVVDLLKGITDGKTAEAAKTQLESLTDKLGGALTSLQALGQASAGNAGTGLGDMAMQAAATVSPEITKSLGGIAEQVTRLLGLEDVKTAIGPLLEKLQGLLPK